MDEQHLKSAKDKVEGNAKEAAGKAFDDKSLELKGKAQQAEGEVREKVGDAKDAVSDDN
ncbi:MAG: CsbD family protein [Pseudomonadota bacterium]